MDGMESIILSKVSQVQEAKGLMFSLISRIQTINTNRTILLKTDHAKRRSHKREGEKKKAIKVNMVDVLAIQ
jgi:hypothetical protein